MLITASSNTPSHIDSSLHAITWPSLTATIACIAAVTLYPSDGILFV